MNPRENWILFDMDGTLCQYDQHLLKSLNALRSDLEPEITEVPHYDWESNPLYVRNRLTLIRDSVEWWRTIPRLQLGFDIWDLADEFEFKKMILTQGPRRNPNAWSGKKMWIDENLGPDVDITITRDKGLVYGTVLVDDYPEYVLHWLKWRPRGLVVMPTNESNKNFKHKQVIHYDGTNLKEIDRAFRCL